MISISELATTAVLRATTRGERACAALRGKERAPNERGARG